jgi:hypothetical protein
MELSSKPAHTRYAKFGLVYLNVNNILVEVDAKDILCGYVEELDRRNMVLTDALDRKQFLMEMYVTNVLGLTINEPYDIIASNDVEDLPEHTLRFKLMQQYTVLPIYDLYKLNWKEFFDQDWADIEFQIKMARKFQQASKIKGNPEDDEEDIMVDESHVINMKTSEVKRPAFKKHF